MLGNMEKHSLTTPKNGHKGGKKQLLLFSQNNSHGNEHCSQKKRPGQASPIVLEPQFLKTSVPYQ